MSRRGAACSRYYTDLRLSADVRAVERADCASAGVRCGGAPERPSRRTSVSADSSSARSRDARRVIYLKGGSMMSTLKAARVRRRGLLVAAVLALAAIGVALAGGAASAKAKTDAGPKPTIVL